MKKILYAALSAGTVAAISFAATGAFFSDTETSTGNTFQAGSLDLKVDSEAHYNGLICRMDDQQVYRWLQSVGQEVPETTPEFYGMECDGTWTETDLGVENKFFNLTDVKPGDDGENTISLHVYDNDAWGKFSINEVVSLDNTCTEPEGETELGGEANSPGCTTEGELHENITFWAWLDQGAIPGFQCGRPDDVEAGARCGDDPTEGDNIHQPGTEPMLIQPGTLDAQGESYDMWPVLAAYRATLDANEVCEASDPDGNGQTSEGIDDPYVVCQGLSDDGRLVGSTTYYVALAWEVADEVGNQIQTDSLVADVEFEVVQHRNNPDKTF